jgi:hypothetical protein
MIPDNALTLYAVYVNGHMEMDVYATRKAALEAICKIMAEAGEGWKVAEGCDRWERLRWGGVDEIHLTTFWVRGDGEEWVVGDLPPGREIG